MGLEVAEYLHDQVSEITVGEMMGQVAKDMGQLCSICVMENLYTSGVKTLTDAKCVEIKDNAVIIENKR
ncbi:MAG: NAD-binding protein [Bacillota bacterium]